ncbi:carboxy-S-adenosyl-L-methionine synthase CmoA [Congregibacter sp.]|uniref:carboxy-S-adenosyl-L-methionine synthase CmoA n=1 Tax=Congregibacter sp. TaxID=2744308 RepID=UPI00385FA019
MTDSPKQPSADTLFSDPLRAPGPFRFDSDVVSVFPDMIRRSVPGYETVIAMSGLLAGRFARSNSSVYDLGCSLGATTLSMRRHIDVANCTIVGIDNSSAMIARCRELIALDAGSTAVDLREGDILESEIANASMVVLNYTLQFVPLEQRRELLHRIADALMPGGILVLSEKVVFPDDSLNQLNIDLHHDFKRAHGYSDLEIAGKRDSIENVLIPESIDQHRLRLSEAGFSSSDVWFQCFNFASIIALK